MLYESLSKFDISDIPTDVSVTSAIVSFYAYIASGGDHRVAEIYPLLVEFVEDEATWDDRKSGVAWSAPGGAEGVDFDSMITSVFGTANTWMHFDITSTVWGWHNGTSTNHGLLLRGVIPDDLANTEFSFRSSEYTTDVTLRPYITIEYGLPVEVVDGFVLTAGSVSLWEPDALADIQAVPAWGLFEPDDDGNYQPVTYANVSEEDYFYELDDNDDIQPKI